MYTYVFIYIYIYIYIYICNICVYKNYKSIHRIPSLSPAASYVQRYALGSNHPANV